MTWLKWNEQKPTENGLYVWLSDDKTVGGVFNIKYRLGDNKFPYDARYMDNDKMYYLYFLDSIATPEEIFYYSKLDEIQ